VYYDGRITGQTTSAAFGYRIGQSVAIAQLNADHINKLDDLSVEFDIAGTMVADKVVIGAVFDPSGTRLLNSN
jgi:4-methylaminobutanoate oxidase (formaldehyde-forming)